MRQIKAKYYPETNEIVPLEETLSLLEDDPIPLTGTDEKGEYKIVNFITGDGDTYYDYDIKDSYNEKGHVVDRTVTTKKIGEEEWNEL